MTDGPDYPVIAVVVLALAAIALSIASAIHRGQESDECQAAGGQYDFEGRICLPIADPRDS